MLFAFRLVAPFGVRFGPMGFGLCVGMFGFVGLVVCFVLCIWGGCNCLFAFWDFLLVCLYTLFVDVMSLLV